MKVLVYCLSSVSGGAVAYLRNMAPLLAKRFAQGDNRHSLKFLAHEDQTPLLEGVEESRICWVRGRRPKGYNRIVWERRNLSRIVHEQESDVFFTPYQISPKVQGPRQILMLRNMEPFLFNQYRYSLTNWLRNLLLRQVSVGCLRRADRIIAVSGLACKQLTCGLGVDAGQVRTIYHGRPNLRDNIDKIQDDELLRLLGIEGDFVLTCGSLLPYRRCEDVIAAFSKCATALGDRVRLVIAGSGTDRRYGATIRRAIATSPVHDRILALGHVPWETMTALYRRSMVCVIATEIEACPNIAIEAMAAGCVIVSTDRAPLPEMFEGCSLEYCTRDICQLAQQMQRAFEDKCLRSEMQIKTLRRADNFSWEKCADETYKALTQWP